MSHVPDAAARRRPPVVRPGRRKPRRGRGSVRRSDIAAALTGITPIGDTATERNAALEREARVKLQETGLPEEDIELVLSDLPSYTAWEIPEGNVPSHIREV